MTPDQIAKSGSEHSIQAAFFAWSDVAKVYGFDAAFYWAEKGVLPKELAFTGKPDAPAIPALKWIHAIPNGGNRGDTVKSRKIEGGKMKAEGVKPGVFDVHWPLPVSVPRLCPGLYIEFKTATGKPSSEQNDFGDFAQSMGFAIMICRTWRHAALVVQAYYNGSRLPLNEDDIL